MNKFFEIVFVVPIFFTALFFIVTGIVTCCLMGGFMGLSAIVLGGATVFCAAVWVGHDLSQGP